MRKNLVACEKIQLGEKIILVVQESYQILKIRQASPCLQFHSLFNVTVRSFLKHKKHDVIDDLCIPKSPRT